MDPKTLQEMIDLRNKSIDEMRALNEACKGESGEIRAMSAEEKDKFDAAVKTVRELDAKIQAEKRDKMLAGFVSTLPVEGADGEKSEAMRDFEAFLKDGNKRTLTIDGEGNTAGALAPTEYIKEILKDLEKDTPILGKVRKIHLNKAQDIEVPVETSEISDAAWTTETGEITADTSQAFSLKKIGCDRIGKLVKASKKAVLSSAFDLPAFIKEELVYKLSCAFENAILNGDGSGKPLGVFTPSSEGVPATQDVTAASQTALTGDDIIRTKRKVPAKFRSNGVRVLHPDVVTTLLLLKDQNGQYIWRTGLKPGDPDILDGSPIIESEFAPHTLTAGLYAGLFGDFSKYWMTILDEIGIQVLLEKYAESGLIGYLADAFAGGKPMNPKAFARIKMAA